jgi:chromosome segregation ATPase
MKSYDFTKNIKLLVDGIEIHNNQVAKHINYAKALHKQLNKYEKRVQKAIHEDRQTPKKQKQLNKAQEICEAAIEALQMEKSMLSRTLERVEQKKPVYDGIKNELINKSKARTDSKQLKHCAKLLSEPLKKLQKNIDFCNSYLMNKHKSTNAKWHKLQDQVQAREATNMFTKISDKVDAKFNNEL